MIADTSLEAYQSIENIGSKQAAVLSAINALGAPTNREIAEHLGWEINRVTPRCLELRERGLVVESDTRQCTIGARNAKTWRAVTSSDFDEFGQGLLI